MTDKLSIPRKIVKAIAMPVGFVATVVGLMALVGLIAESGWVRVPVALIVTIAVPAVVSDRLLPNDEEKPKGLVSDVFALTWLGFAVIFVVALGGRTRALLIAEGDRLERGGYGMTASAAYALAGVDTERPVPAPDASGSASATVSAATSAAPSATATATASASASGAPATSASAAPPPKDPDEELSPAEIFKKLAPAVVTVHVKKGPMEGGGTGFLIGDKGIIATNEHVVSDATEAVIRFIDGSSFEDVWVLDVDADADLALLQVDLSKPTEGDPVDVEPLLLGDSDAVTVGEKAISIGNPLGLEHTLTTGIVSARRTYKGKHWIQMSTPISPGNSGGPVFNAKGEVIGITTATILGGFGGMAQNLNLAVPVNVLKGKIKVDYPGKRKFGKAGGPKHW